MTLYADIPGERLDAFLARCGENLSRSAAQRLIEEGHVTRNGKPGKKNANCSLSGWCTGAAAPLPPSQREVAKISDF